MDRREWLGALGCGLLAAGQPAFTAEQEKPKRPRIAAVFTAWQHRWHAHVILENFLEPYLFNGKMTEPGVDVVSFYADQFPRRDMAKKVAADYRIPIHKTIAAALCQGGDKLAVDGVLLIAEHGNYPVNSKGQREYPRKQFFDECLAVFRRSGAVAPVFVDKHLSYRWDWAKQMVDDARALKVPLMAGSSVPLAERRPALELPPRARLTEAVSIHGGPFEGYDIHAMEVLQSIVEGREGAETGIASVEYVPGTDLLARAAKGDWSIELADTALAAELGRDQPSLRKLLGERAPLGAVPHGILLEYTDGLRAMILKIGRSSTRWNFACRVRGEKSPLATSFRVGPWQNRNLFKALSHAIQHHFRERRPPYPALRTLLTTGALAAAVDSRAECGRRVLTPHLAIRYTPTDFSRFRETGASWKILTDDTPEPEGITKGGHRPAPKK